MLLNLSAVLKTFVLLLGIVGFPVAAADQTLPVSPQRFLMGIYYPSIANLSIANLVTLADFQLAINMWCWLCFFKQADVGLSNAEVLNLMIELNPQLQQSLAVLAKFPTKSPTYGYFHSDFPVQVRQAITEKVKELNQQPRPQQVLQALRMVSLVPNAVDNLAVFDDLLDEHRSLEAGIKP